MKKYLLFVFVMIMAMNSKADQVLTIKSSLRPEQLAELDKLADDIVLSLQWSSNKAVTLTIILGG